VKLDVSGDWNEKFVVEWQRVATEEVGKSWNDEQELTEYAAMGVAVILARELTGYTDFKRARKGDGMDFWLGKNDENGLPVLEALLEVSGIMKESQGNTTAGRVSLKKKQLTKSPYKNLPAYVVVVEFNTPKSKFISL
jgi:hypothetical protein